MSIDRLERLLPDVLTELSLPRVPDYTDDLLSRTARMSQRPGWTFPERWFPMSTMTSAVTPGRRPIPLRPLLILAILSALVLASVAWWVGSQKTTLPPLTGPARNGMIVAILKNGDLVTVDTATDAQHTIARGTDLCCATVAPNGQRVSYLHVPAGGSGAPTSLVVADLNGATVRETPGDVLGDLQEAEWAPQSDRILLTTSSGPKILDVGSGTATALTVPFGVTRASWIGATGDILLTSKVDDTTLRVLRLAAGSTNPTQVAELRYAVDAPRVSPDGTKFVYFIWGPEPRLQGRVHVVDLATREDAEVTPLEAVGAPHVSEWENPVWSPDSASIAVERYVPSGPMTVAIIPATGGSSALLGRSAPTDTGGANIRFSPDGKSVLVTYHADGATWLLPVTGEEGRLLAWAAELDDIDWQRLAP